MDTNITKTWTIEINENEVFSRCTNETLYQAYNRTPENEKGDALVMQDDDRGMFHMYYATAIAHLHMMLAKRMDDPAITNEGVTTVTLQMHDNHDDNILPILVNHCYEYVVRKVLEQWYRVDFGSELERFEVTHCLYYRKNPVRRRVAPLI